MVPIFNLSSWKIKRGNKTLGLEEQTSKPFNKGMKNMVRRRDRKNYLISDLI